MGVQTISDHQLDKLIQRAADYAYALGEEGALIAAGKLPREIRKSQAMKRLGPVSYNVAVKNGDLIERKLSPGNKNSHIVVDSKQVIYVEKIAMKS